MIRTIQGQTVGGIYKEGRENGCPASLPVKSYDWDSIPEAEVDLGEDGVACRNLGRCGGGLLRPDPG